MKNRTMKPPARLTGNYGASNLDKGGGKTLDNYKRLQKVLNFAKGAGFGLITAALELPEVLDIINNKSLSDKQKAILMGPILGRTIGAAGFAAFGSAVGLASPIPGGALIGGGALGYLGYISGDRAGEFLADFLLGGSPKLGPEEAKIAKTFMEDKLRKMAEGQNYGDTVRATSIFDRTLPQDINLAGTGLGVQNRLTGSNYQNLVSSLGSINSSTANQTGPASVTSPAYVFNDNGTRVTNNQAALFDGGPIINMQDQFAGGT